MPDDFEGWQTVDLSQYDDETVAKAFWLQEHIRRYGIDGIHFTKRAKRVAEVQGPKIVAHEISQELKKL